MSSNSELPLGALDLHDEHILLPPSAKVSDAAKALLENPEHNILIYEGVAKKGMFSFLGGKKEKVLGIISLETLMHSLDEKKRISGKHSITKAMKSVLLEYHVGTPLELVVNEITEKQPYGVIARADDGTFVGFMSMGDFQEARALVSGRVPPSETRTIRHGPSATLSNLLKPDPSTGILASKPMILHPHQTFGKLIDSLVLNINGQAIVSKLSKKDITEGLSSLFINQISGTANVRTVLKILASGQAPKPMKLSESKHLDIAWLNMSEESLFSRVKESSSKGGWNSLLVTDSRDRVLAAFSKTEFARHQTGGQNSASSIGGGFIPAKKAKAPFIQGSASNSSELGNVLEEIEKINGISPPEIEEHGEDNNGQVLELDEEYLQEYLSTSEGNDLTNTTVIVSIPIPLEEPEEEIEIDFDPDFKPEVFNMDDPNYGQEDYETTIEQNIPPPPPPSMETSEMQPPTGTPPIAPSGMDDTQTMPPMNPPPMPPQMPRTTPPSTEPPTSSGEDTMSNETKKTSGGRYV
ncbi:MAG: hypothetical protein CMB49_00560 [Euryarchaeota archaeon]|nr:hypothetical protein [Euryarchaeota archaeon]